MNNEKLINKVLIKSGCIVKVDASKRAQEIKLKQSKDELNILINRLIEENKNGSYKNRICKV